MAMLSNTCKYAIRAVIYLAMNAEEGKKIGIRKISKSLEIPAPFLGKIMQTLAKHKLLSSTKGPHGGFALNRSADDISLFDIVEIIDGVDLFHECFIGLEICTHNPEYKKTCAFHPKYDPLRSKIINLFKQQTIANLADGIGDMKNILHF